MRYRSNFITNEFGDPESMDKRGFLHNLKDGLEIALLLSGGKYLPRLVVVVA